MTHNPRAAPARPVYCLQRVTTQSVPLPPPDAELHEAVPRCPHSLALELLTDYVPQLGAALASLPPLTDAAHIPCGMSTRKCLVRDDALCVCFDRAKQEDTVVYMRGKGGVLECSICT